MATRRKTEDSTSAFDFDSVTAAQASAPVVAFKPNPLKKLVQQSIDEGYAPLEIVVPKAAEKDAVNMLRRAVLPVNKGGLDVGLRLTQTDQPDGTVVIAFQTKAEKKNRTYTTADVRAWAEANGAPKADIYPRVKREVSRAYRVAMGLEVVEAE